jgi:histidinol dehydrogenase
MKIVTYPLKGSWPMLCRRPASDYSEVDPIVREILGRIKTGGDSALRFFTEKYDGPIIRKFKVTAGEIAGSAALVAEELRLAILTAKENIAKFHRCQIPGTAVVETYPGVSCWQKSVPVETAGLYVPGGTAPLFSTVLMLAVPASLAGCSRIVLCTPPEKDGRINPAILFAASVSGVTDIFTAGGAQAIAAMAYGTESVPRVDKIFGPGNMYVTRAKEMIQLDGVPIDMPAGPSEVLVISDNTGNPSFIAADLLSQAEHGPDSQVLFLTDKPEMITAVKSEVENQLEDLPRKEIAAKSLENSMLILMISIEECVGFSNFYAPEHLILATSDPASLSESIRNAGSVFLGKYSCESAGDYASGTNHTLPTGGFARNYSGVTTGSFMKTISFQEISGDGLRSLGPVIEKLAEAEQLHGHRNAVTIRLNSLSNVRS